jgi:hypothetical protein
MAKGTETTRSIKFGSDKRRDMSDRHADRTPGPNVYNPTENLKFISKSSPAYGFGVGIQRPQSMDTTKGPGPGTYSI